MRRLLILNQSTTRGFKGRDEGGGRRDEIKVDVFSCFILHPSALIPHIMSYLIDGNNLMAQRANWREDLTLARRGVLDDLAAFKLRTQTTVSVVFDGAPDSFFPDGATYRGVRVMYARRGSDADSRIKEIVDASRERRTLYVITSDRALGEYVRRSGAPVVRSNDFQRRVDETTRAARDEKMKDAKHDGETKAVDEWLRYFGVEPHE